jgi:hypothetical protein
MTVTISHKKTQAETIRIVDTGADKLFTGAAGPSVEITDQTKEWIGNVMHFSFNAKFGFISVPLKGTIDVGDEKVIVDCELPSFVDKFLGPGKVGASIEKRIQLLLE